LQLVAKLCEAGFTGPEGKPLIQIRADDKKYREVRYARRGVVSGEIRMYSPSWVLVRWRANTTALDAEGSRVHGSMDDAVRFLTLAFINGDESSALDVPEYIPKRARRRGQKPELCPGEIPAEEIPTEDLPF
jgi:hypothetical protein